MKKTYLIICLLFVVIFVTKSVCEVNQNNLIVRETNSNFIKRYGVQDRRVPVKFRYGHVHNNRKRKRRCSPCRKRRAKQKFIRKPIGVVWNRNDLPMMSYRVFYPRHYNPMYMRHTNIFRRLPKFEMNPYDTKYHVHQYLMDPNDMQSSSSWTNPKMNEPIPGQTLYPPTTPKFIPLPKNYFNSPPLNQIQMYQHKSTITPPSTTKFNPPKLFPFYEHEAVNNVVNHENPIPHPSNSIKINYRPKYHNHRMEHEIIKPVYEDVKEESNNKFLIRVEPTPTDLRSFTSKDEFNSIASQQGTLIIVTPSPSTQTTTPALSISRSSNAFTSKNSSEDNNILTLGKLMNINHDHNKKVISVQPNVKFILQGKGNKSSKSIKRFSSKFSSSSTKFMHGLNTNNQTEATLQTNILVN